MKLLKDHNTQVLLGKFLSGEMSELEPVYDPTYGYRYPIADAILNNNLKTQEFLDRLHEAEILEKKLYDKVILCPKCGDANISIHYNCPYCRSFNIQKSSLIEHIKCGYMDIEENFRKGHSLVCPRCHEELRKSDIDYRRAGVWCTCKECGKSFDIPTTSHFCRNCHANSTFEDAVVRDVYAYSLKEGVREEAAADWKIITPIGGFLRKNGFEVENPGFLEGKSGANHMFDMVAYKGDGTQRTTVIDLAVSTEDVVPEQPVIALFAKIFDVSPDYAYLITIPGISENGRKMAKLYNIRVIEAKNQEEVRKGLENTLLTED